MGKYALGFYAVGGGGQDPYGRGQESEIDKHHRQKRESGLGPVLSFPKCSLEIEVYGNVRCFYNSQVRLPLAVSPTSALCQPPELIFVHSELFLLPLNTGKSNNPSPHASCSPLLSPCQLTVPCHVPHFPELRKQLPLLWRPLMLSPLLESYFSACFG